MYDFSNPAPNINVLYDYLLQDHKDYYCYRGQTKEYDYLIPSLYRKHIEHKDFASNYGYLHINPSIDEYSEQRKMKLQEMRRLLKEFGSSIGNILAQQYGLSSECLDITSDLRVATFFATHNYPSYSLYNGNNKNNNVGVIYRINIGETYNMKYSGVEFMKSALYVMHDYFPYNNYPILFSHHRKNLDCEQLSLLEQYMPYRKVIAYTPCFMLGFDQIKHLIKCYVEENNSNHFLLEYMETTRFFKQSGGMLIPSILYESSIPSSTSPLFYNQLGSYINKPGVAIIEKMIGIYDISKYSFVEKFYFYHGCCPDNSIEINCKDLWPSVENDYYYNIIAQMVVIACMNYLEKYKISYDDQKLGILDRGYY